MLTEALFKHEINWISGWGARLTLQETIKDIQDAWVDGAENEDQVSVILQEKNNQNG